MRILRLLCLFILILGFCRCNPAPVTPKPAVVTATEESSQFQKLGGGEPRSINYWLLWNTCTEGNQSAIAIGNGGRTAGWILLDDLLQDPGILVGNLELLDCDEAVQVLRAVDGQDTDRSADPVYLLAQQLTAAQLNLAAGATYCPVSDLAVSTAQFLLLGLEFTGTGSYLPPPRSSPHLTEIKKLISQLEQFNNGSLCR